jgi:pimeloyl-ACP methyl ester carboxylesterase
MLHHEQRTVVTEDGTSLNVRVLTAGDTGPSTPTVVMAHGWTLSSESWLPVVRALAHDDVRIVLWDQRGHGASALGLRRNEIRTASVTRLGRDLHTVISAVVPAASPIVLAGHSMGGMTVLSYAGQFPLQLQERVRGVLLVATAAGGLRMGRRRGEKTFMKVLAHGLPVAAGPAITARSQRALLFGDDADPQHVRATRAQVGATPLPTMGTFYGALSRLDEERSLGRLQGLHGLPVVILVGARDRLTPAILSERLASGIPGSRLTVLPGKGHMLTYEATDEVVAALRDLIAA